MGSGARLWCRAVSVGWVARACWVEWASGFVSLRDSACSGLLSMGVYLAELNGHHGEFWHLGHLGLRGFVSSVGLCHSGLCIAWGSSPSWVPVSWASSPPGFKACWSSASSWLGLPGFVSLGVLGHWSSASLVILLLGLRVLQCGISLLAGISPYCSSRAGLFSSLG